MLIVSNTVILDWLAEDGFSLGESSWVHVATLKRCWQITATRDGHKYTARAPKRKQAVVNLGLLVGYPLDE